MTDPISTGISLFALLISGTTAWLTLFRRGTVRMTKPTVIFFGPDGRNAKREKAPLKVFLRALVYSTGKKGHIIENMYVTLQRGETRQTFNVWIYGDDKLARGSGVFVGETGVVCNHHFLLPNDGTPFAFMEGEYRLDVHASLVGMQKAVHLSSIVLSISETASVQLKEPNAGIYFDWGSESDRYHAHVENRKFTGPEELLGLLAENALAGNSRDLPPR